MPSGSLNDLILAALLIWAAVMAVMDWRQRRVPNALLLLALLPTLGVLALTGKSPLGAHWLAALVGFVVAFAVTLPGYLVSKLGAGDVKLAAVMGLITGWPMAGWVLMATALLLGAMSLIWLLAAGLAGVRGVRMPAAVAFAGGFGAVLLWQRGGWA